MAPVIRPERTQDHGAIHDITQRAFAPMPFAAGDEQDLIGALRTAGALSLSLVAEVDGGIAGQVSFSPAFAADGSAGWYALGPIAVEPALQGQGIGGQLIKAGIACLGDRDAAGCSLVGNPNYYRRFGFRPYPHCAPPNEPAEFFQILPLRVTEPATIISFHRLFHGA